MNIRVSWLAVVALTSSMTAVSAQTIGTDRPGARSQAERPPVERDPRGLDQGCITAEPDAVINMLDPAITSPAYANSPGRNYGHPTCDRFIAQYLWVYEAVFAPFGEITATHLPRTKRECDATRVSAMTFGRRASDERWERLQYYQWRFSWRDNRCILETTPPPIWQDRGRYLEARVAVKATTLWGWKLPVTAGLAFIYPQDRRGGARPAAAAPAERGPAAHK